MEKLESLEQAAREWCIKNISNYEMLNVWTDTDVHCVMAQFAEQKSAERERQVWAEAAKVASEYGKWISVKEKLPGLGDLVLLHSTAIGMNMFLGRRHSERCDGGIWVNGKFCTHWLALPNPPKV